MKTVVRVSVFLTVLIQLSRAVTVKEGDFEFSLESVKALGALMTSDEVSAEQDLEAVCSHPDLPRDFKPLCLRYDPGAALARLADVASHPDDCEICVSVACYGC
ncbi:guanylate cyclase activator 2B-like [Cheilinus undulatus]|uniref:guanylate cyclase activator 2B-like n=1 Tax=Cheilinus undulatus TaxID=241271 RepID=UPI001BD332EE|nr:guanylate cyclase activator 2B-like [Cheilinus undulatus]